MKEPQMFYDIMKKEKFETTQYTVETILVKGKPRYVAKTVSPSGKKCCVIITIKKYEDNKDK